MKIERKQRRTLLVLLSLSIMILFMLVAYFNSSSPRNSDELGFMPYFPLAGKEVSLAQAQAVAPFKISMPTKMGPFIQIRSEGEVVIIIYGSVKPSDADTIQSLTSQKSVILIENPNTKTLQMASETIRDSIDATKNDVGGGLQPVTINGYFGCAGGNIGHAVRWFTETTEYELIAGIDYPLQQLIEMANSIPVS